MYCCALKWLLTTVAAVTLLLGGAVASADDSFQPSFDPTLNVIPINGSISVDGRLDDSGWRDAVRASGFAEVSPGDQTKPPVESAALITYDASNLYVALIAWDDPSNIRVSLRDRDNIFRDDYFGLLFDTYGDFAWAYELFVNPVGIQGDLRIESDGSEDISFDVVFESRGMVTDSGYQVELAIPFSSLRFPDQPEQVWRINFWRDHQRDARRRYAWAAQDRNDPCWICQWGTMTGIKDVKPSTNIDILPNIIAYQSGSRSEPLDKLDNSDPDAELSLNVRYGLSSNSSVELTVNPDFSQVESDAAQIDVNSTYGLYYSERRPFFQEGSDLFRTTINAVYTRSINDPQLATKFTGQFGRTSVAYLLARDEHTPLVIPLDERSVQRVLDKSISNIVRVRQTFGRNSSVGMTFTDRRVDDFSLDGDKHSGGSGTVYGVDGRVRFAQNYRLEWQVLGSYVTEPNAPDLIDTTEADGIGQVYIDDDGHTVALDGESLSGFAARARLRRDTRYVSLSADYHDFSPTFRTDNGFTTRNAYRQGNVNGSVSFQPNRQWLLEWQMEFNAGRVWEYSGHFRDEWFCPQVQFDFRSQTQIVLDMVFSRERYRGVLIEGIRRTEIEIASRPSEMISGGFWIEFGRSIYRTVPVLADGVELVGHATFKPLQRLIISPVVSYAKMTSREDGSTYFEGHIWRTRFDYQFTRRLFARLVMQYDNFDDYFSVEPLLTYRVNPFTVFYLGSSNGYEYYDRNDYAGLSDSQWILSERHFFAKFQYLFRI